MNVLLVGVGFSVGTMLLPPDPLTQLLVTIAVVILAIPISYWLVYGGGLARLRGRVGN
ncbi:hypothetical protein HAPAU_20630 [Halalkalicoccus paucihalophilus]|uniref:Uncharacterized protein n=2 Tax=Halalkalicoccus paucihalophilus TaxID=1008153 RepID=A0A151ACP6_9EURY|nr:hypothetical protein HAPAU_20630 [Halalkalicoccus paucihalophilus]